MLRALKNIVNSDSYRNGDKGVFRNLSNVYDGTFAKKG